MEKWGIVSDDWLELAPQYSWLPGDQLFFAGLICRNENKDTSETAGYRYLRAVQTPVDDNDDSSTGFDAVERDFSWSGFDGRASVVTFGDEFLFDRNIKFVIWDRANNAPVWRLTNQFLLSFEFFECGDSIYPGCHEAMSDRQRPDHIHGIIIINKHIVTSLVGTLHATTLPQHDAANLIDENMSSISPKSGSLSVVVRSYKSAVSNHARKSNSHFAWQPKFHDTIICTSGQLKRIRKYVLDNPKNWNDAVSKAIRGTLR